KLDEAIAAYRRAIEIKPNYPEPHNALGRALQNQRKLEEAIAEWRKALALDPNLRSALWNLSAVLANGHDPKLRDPREAMELAKKGIHLGERGGGWQTLGWAYYRAGA